ncbi:MAG: hypothetical protein ACRYGR_10750 [Janthinobacterium lividum]
MTCNQHTMIAADAEVDPPNATWSKLPLEIQQMIITEVMEDIAPENLRYMKHITYAFSQQAVIPLKRDLAIATEEEENAIEALRGYWKYTHGDETSTLPMPLLATSGHSGFLNSTLTPASVVRHRRTVLVFNEDGEGRNAASSRQVSALVKVLAEIELWRKVRNEDETKL